MTIQGIASSLQLMSGGIAFSSAVHWMRSARVKISWAGISTLGAPAHATIEQLNRQATHNKYAAWTAAAAALMQSAGMLLQGLATKPPF